MGELLVNGIGVLKEIELTVDITHSYRGDLRVSIETPGNLTALVHDRAGSYIDNIKKVFTPLNTPSLRDLLNSGININGTWKLHVSDNAPDDKGKLNSWKLKLIT